MTNVSLMMEPPLQAYLTTLQRCAESVEVADHAGVRMAPSAGVARMMEMVRSCSGAGGRIMFIGNGGSSGIAGHMAIDYAKNGGFSATAFNDSAALTCLANDLGYENVFSRQIEIHARPGDLLVAISSSGRSPNILKAVEAARTRDCSVVTLSGFQADNPLRPLGDLNFYVASDQYGPVEITHLVLCHAVLDFTLGWKPATVDK